MTGDLLITRNDPPMSTPPRFNTIRNLTPHPITLVLPDGTRVTISPSGDPVRVNFSTGGPQDTFLGVPIYSATEWLDVVNLPDPIPGCLIVVSYKAAQHIRGRQDVAYPGTAATDEAIRGLDGKVVAVTRLVLAQP